MNTRLIEARKRAHLSVAALALKAGVTERVVRYAETGGRTLDSNQFAIAGALGMDVLELWPIEPEDEAA